MSPRQPAGDDHYHTRAQLDGTGDREALRASLPWTVTPTGVPGCY